MNMKRFHEMNMHTALQKIREELGEDAVIISSKQDKKGVEVVAATDYEAVSSSESKFKYNIEKKCTNNKVSKPSRDYKNINPTTPSNNNIDTLLLQKEISQLRRIIESQTEIISWNNLINDNSITRKLLQNLSITGFGFNLSKKLLDKVKKVDNFDTAWKLIRKIIERSISITQKNVIESGGIVALVGPTGVGKTTTIAKIAAQYALNYSNRDIALISTDHYRIGAHDQINTYGSILNVPVVAANNGIELQRALNIVKDKKLVLIDTAGLSQRDCRVKEIMKALSEQSKELITYLVVSASTQLCVQKEIINQFTPSILNGVIISKTDEASQIGGILTVLMEQGLPVAYETTGQRVPEDIVRPSQNDLVNKAIKLGAKFGNMESIHPTELYSELVENV